MKALNTTFPLAAYADSRQGGRAENQDSAAWGDTPAGFLVTVCDGMGGGPSGKEASSLATRGLLEYIQEHGEKEKDRRKLMLDAIVAANQGILDAVEADPSKKGMGTTLTALLINEYSAVVAHVGDSRVYQFRQGRKHFRTNDHSLVFAKLLEHEIKSEEEARTHPDSNIILRALGINAQVKPGIVELAYEKGDRFMLCTDGIWGMFPEKNITAMAARTPVLSGAVENLVVRVDEEGFANGGGHDNLTLAMVETKTNSKMQEKMSTRQKNLFIAVAALCLLSVLLNVFLLVKYVPTGRRSGATVDAAKLDELVQLKVESQMAEFKEQFREEQNLKMEKMVSNLDSDNPELTKAAVSDMKNNLELRKELEDIMKDVKKLATMSKGPEKDKLVDGVKDRFEKFVSKAGDKVDAKTAAKVKDLLSHGIAKQDDKGDPNEKVKGHYLKPGSGIYYYLELILEKL